MDDRNEVQRKVAKLLRLAERGGTPEEAATAAGVALPAAGPLFDLPEPARPAAPALQLDAFNLDLFGV